MLRSSIRSKWSSRGERWRFSISGWWIRCMTRYEVRRAIYIACDANSLDKDPQQIRDSVTRVFHIGASSAYVS